VDIPSNVLSILVLVALVLSATAALMAFNGTGRKRPEDAGPIQMDENLEAILQAYTNKMSRLEGALRRLAAEAKRQNEVVRGSVQNVGMIRYDAFEDVGGQLSFSCALLDDRGDGVVITSINGRQDTRVYAKPVKAGRSSHNLSEEETSAIRQALERPREAVTAG
jgi:hypothetical protein